MKYKTSDLPGIGKRHSIITHRNSQIVIITHQHGQREIYYFKKSDQDEPDIFIQLTDEEARQIGAIFLGVDYQPVSEDKMELMLENLLINWVEIKPKSFLANKSIKEAQVRKNTGATIIGIKRGEEIIGSPDPLEVILPGDILMVIGKRNPIKEIENICKNC